jgi:hypothetical protein
MMPAVVDKPALEPVSSANAAERYLSQNGVT